MSLLLVSLMSCLPPWQSSDIICWFYLSFFSVCVCACMCPGFLQEHPKKKLYLYKMSMKQVLSTPVPLQRTPPTAPEWTWLAQVSRALKSDQSFWYSTGECIVAVLYIVSVQILFVICVNLKHTVSWLQSAPDSKMGGSGRRICIDVKTKPWQPCFVLLHSTALSWAC